MSRIVVADDNDLARDALCETLIGAGHDVIACSNGAQAWQVLKEGRCRLILCDWMMPEMDGVQLCRQVRQHDLPGYVYFILLTSRDSQQDVVDGLSMGADDFIVKPFRPAELLARVRTGERIASLETRDVAIFAMAKLAESRDPDIGTHLERMRNYSRILAADLLDRGVVTGPGAAEYPRLIFLTSPLHDIGKVGIPDCVLLKPGGLNDREYEVMKTHTTIGAETLEAAVSQFPNVAYLTLARDIALFHHERYDGTGYPHGLSSERIPMCGRIVALADVYDALTTKRVYKNAFTHEVARSMILEETGKHFDPVVIEAFLRQEERFLEVLDRYAELELART